MSGKKSQNKGKRGERGAAKAVSEALGIQAHRGRQYQGGADSPDIKTSLEGVHFEVKRTEKLRIYAALQQAVEEAGGDIPVVLHRKNHEEWVVILRLSDVSSLAKIVCDALNSLAETSAEVE